MVCFSHNWKLSEQSDKRIKRTFDNVSVSSLPHVPLTIESLGILLTKVLQVVQVGGDY